MNSRKLLPETNRIYTVLERFLSVVFYRSKMTENSPNQSMIHLINSKGNCTVKIHMVYHSILTVPLRILTSSDLSPEPYHIRCRHFTLPIIPSFSPDIPSHLFITTETTRPLAATGPMWPHPSCCYKKFQAARVMSCSGPCFPFFDSESVIPSPVSSFDSLLSAIIFRLPSLVYLQSSIVYFM